MLACRSGSGDKKEICYLKSLQESDLFVQFDIVGLQVGDFALQGQELRTQPGLFFFKFFVSFPEPFALGLKLIKAI